MSGLEMWCAPSVSDLRPSSTVRLPCIDTAASQAECIVALHTCSDQSVHGSPARLLPVELSPAGPGAGRHPRVPPALFKPAPPVSTQVPPWRPLDTPASPSRNGLHLLLRVCEALDPAGEHCSVVLSAAMGTKRAASPSELLGQLCSSPQPTSRASLTPGSAAKRVRRMSSGGRGGALERATISGPCTNPDCERPLVSPQWRKGPPSNPILCNACGTRWLRNGTLKPLVVSGVFGGGRGTGVVCY